MDGNMKNHELRTFSRNHFHHGQLLTEHSLNLEQKYFKEKIWLRNRLITGYGVVCGLDVRPADDRRSVYVTPGVALDRWGREIVVPEPTKPQPLPLPPDQANGAEQAYVPREEDEHVHVSVCFHECLADPQPLVVSECDGVDRCAPGTVRERYRIVIKPGKAPGVPKPCSIPDLLIGDRIDYGALARRVTQDCRRVKDDPCVPLANVRLPQANQHCHYHDIDITVRPIVYSNDLLFELILALLNASQDRSHGGKP